jgi:hypothetical protein
MAYDVSLSTIDIYLDNYRLLDKTNITTITLPKTHNLQKSKQGLPQGKSITVVSMSGELTINIAIKVIDRTFISDIEALFANESFIVTIVDKLSGEEFLRYKDCTIMDAPDYEVAEEGMTFTLNLSVGGNADEVLQDLANGILGV